MKVFIVTLFPEMFASVLEASMLKRARQEGYLDTALVNPRDFTVDSHKTVDDYPYGGGPGMVMKPEPIYRAVESVEMSLEKRPYVVLMTPQGEVFNSTIAADLAKRDNLVLIAGHYEGFDERIRFLADRQLSIGDYVLTGGELPSMIVLDAVSRFLPGVLGDEASSQDDSFCLGLLEGPQYTRPPDFRGMRVPDVLLSGNTGLVSRWRKKESLRRTLLYRRDLLDSACLTFQERCLLEEVYAEECIKNGRLAKE